MTPWALLARVADSNRMPDGSIKPAVRWGVIIGGVAILGLMALWWRYGGG